LENRPPLILCLVLPVSYRFLVRHFFPVRGHGPDVGKLGGIGGNHLHVRPNKRQDCKRADHINQGLRLQGQPSQSPIIGRRLRCAETEQGKGAIYDKVNVD